MGVLISWKVLWIDEDGKKIFRRFNELAPPVEAIQFAKELKKKGIKPTVISSNKAWPPTREQQLKRKPGDMWCPYCIRWRQFKLFALKKNGYVSNAFMRCPVCTISTSDYWVKKFNNMIEHLSESELIRKLAKG